MFERSRASRVPLVAAVAALVLILVLLATLQYRWVGQVGEAERVRLQAGARTRVEQLAQEFDREVSRAFAGLQADADVLGPDGATRFAARYERWAARTEHPSLVSAVYVLSNAGGARGLRRFDPATRTFVDAEWPPQLTALRERLEAMEPGRPEHGGFRGPFSPVWEEGPALVAPIFAAETRPGPDPEGAAREHVPGRPDHGFGRTHAVLGSTVLLLDRSYIERELLPALAARYFAAGGEFDYAVVVTSRRDPRTVVYRSEGDESALTAPDAATGLFDVRFDPLEAAVFRREGAPSGLFLRRPPHDGRRPMGPPPGMDRGVWQVAVRHRSGSLEQVVARTRRRNLMISFGTLLLLGLSAGLVVVSSQHARRLAAQQVEFVAGVSHELRTPVAVVCAAGENLADGLVREPAEVKVYGATVRDEGRRLAEMIEQVLEFAGITARERRRPRERIAVADLVADAVKACAGTVGEGGLEVEVRIPPALPALAGDRAALRRALQNLIQNSARHAAAGGWIGVSAARARVSRHDVVRITVRDRGPGIPAGEERKVFQAFYRGRQALAAGVSGSGLGLSLVQRIVEAHGGAVELETAPGAGSAFTLVLPARDDPKPAAATFEEEDAQADPAR